MTSEYFLKQAEAGVLLISFNSSHKKNAFTNAAWRSLAVELDAAKQDDDVTVVVLTGVGDDFSAGHDLADSPEKDAEGNLAYQYTERALAAFDKPLLMCPKGYAIGGAATMLLHADMVYAGESLKLKLPFAALGLSPEFGSSYLLPKVAGPQLAAEMLFCGEFVTADEALASNIVTRVYSDTELLEKTLEIARSIAAKRLDALRMAKRCLIAARRDALSAAYRVEAKAIEDALFGR
ncbi:MAG: enoyl-CoA hydratase-related protein [Pseudomonadota bacterium]